MSVAPASVSENTSGEQWNDRSCSNKQRARKVHELSLEDRQTPTSGVAHLPNRSEVGQGISENPLAASVSNA